MKRVEKHMNEFKRNPIATDEDYFELSDQVYDDQVLEKVN